MSYPKSGVRKRGSGEASKPSLQRGQEIYLQVQPGIPEKSLQRDADAGAANPCTDARCPQKLVPALDKPRGVER